MESPFVPSEVLDALTVEQALHIDDNRFIHLGFIMDDVWAKHAKKADAITAIANTPGLSNAEKVYMGYKLHERICKRKIPGWSLISRKL